MNLTEENIGNLTNQLPGWHQAIIVTLVSLSLPAAALNLCVSVVAYHLFKSTQDTIHLFILSMTLADFLLTGVAAPLEHFGNLAVAALQLPLTCVIMHFSNWLGLAVSAISLSMLNIEKLIYFQWPLHYERLISTRKAAVIIFALWSLCISFVAIVILGVARPSACSVYIVPPGWIYYTHTVLFCTVPILTSAFLSVYLYCLTKRMRQYAPPGGSQQNQSERSANIKSLVFIFVTTAWTVVSLLPFRLFNLVRLSISEQSLSEYKLKIMAWVFFFLLMLNPIVNPIITATIYVPYRKSWKKLFLKFKDCGRSRWSYDTRESGETNLSLLRPLEIQNRPNTGSF